RPRSTERAPTPARDVRSRCGAPASATSGDADLRTFKPSSSPLRRSTYSLSSASTASSGAVDTTFAPQLNGAVDALAVAAGGTAIFAGGEFSSLTVNGMTTQQPPAHGTSV